jgi:hypothetical protein
MSSDAEYKPHSAPGQINAPRGTEVHAPGEGIDLPASTFWPMVLAFGITLMFAGLVTHIAVTIVGVIIAVRASLGWWHQVIPHEEHEFVPMRVVELRPKPVRVSSRGVAHLKAGESKHRVRIPAEIHPYSAGIKGGLAGGAAMAALACLYGQFAHGSIWYPVNLLAASVMPRMATATDAQLNQFDATAFGAALIGHVIVSILVGLLYAVSLPMFPRRAPLWAGILAPLFWSGLVASSLELIDPALNHRINWPWFVVCQLGFGLVGGFVVARSEQIETMQTWPMASRIALEGGVGPGKPEDGGTPKGPAQ